MKRKAPKLRMADKRPGPYPLGVFPRSFAYDLGREVVYLLATRPAPSLEGGDWEQVFARLAGARWKPSNVGLDDVVLEKTAWGAKTVHASNPAKAKRVRLISGRNSPEYSYGVTENPTPDELGEMVLGIWNARVSEIRAKYENVRTVVLLKSDDLLEMSMFELETMLYAPEDYEWATNKNGNLLGHSRRSKEHKFTWQPHGSQFTIVEEVPDNRLTIRIRRPDLIEAKTVLDMVKFDESWVEVVSMPS